MPIDNFGIKLKEFRIRKGLTQKELSKKLFVSRKSVSKWETGRGMPDDSQNSRRTRSGDRRTV